MHSVTQFQAYDRTPQVYTLRCATPCADTMLTGLATITIRPYYLTTDCIPCVVSFIVVTYSFRNWKPAPLHPFCPSPNRPRTF